MLIQIAYITQLHVQIPFYHFMASSYKNMRIPYSATTNNTIRQKERQNLQLKRLFHNKC